MDKITVAKAYYKAQYLQETAGTYLGERLSFEEWICLKAMDFEKQIEIASDGVSADVRVSAIQLAKDLSEWSNKYPRGRIYGMNGKDDMDGQLIKLEERAKELLPHLP